MGEAEGKAPDVVSTHAFTVSCASEKGAPCVSYVISADWVCLPQRQSRRRKIVSAVSISGTGVVVNFKGKRTSPLTGSVMIDGRLKAPSLIFWTERLSLLAQ